MRNKKLGSIPMLFVSIIYLDFATSTPMKSGGNLPDSSPILVSNTVYKSRNGN